MLQNLIFYYDKFHILKSKLHIKKTSNLIFDNLKFMQIFFKLTINTQKYNYT